MRGAQLWFLILIAVLAVVVLTPGLRRWITLLLLGDKGRARVGRQALARQPDRITLTARPDPPGAEAPRILGGLTREGFSPAGSFAVAEMGGLPIHFMVKPAESAVAAVYEHPKAGVWCDLFTRYQDGTSFTFATARMGGGLEQRPGHPVVRAAGLDPAAGHARFLRERPARAMKSFAAAEVPRMFADAYAESIAWRKQRGISGDEVAKVGMDESK